MKRSTKFYNKNEKEIMESLGLIPTKRSGAGWIEKEDGYNEYLLAQHKSTDANSYRISLDDINKLEYHASTSHKIPVFVIQFLQTNDIFILARPIDLPNITEYLKCGKCEITKLEFESNIEETKPKKTKMISSGNRENFWKEKQKQFEERLKYGKSNKV